MKFRTIKKWVFRIITLQLVLIIAVAIWMDYEINGMWGGHTDVADHAQFKTPQSLIAITNVNAMSADGNTMLPNQRVVIKSGKIQSISANANAPKGATIIDGRGKYLIPGLIDSHVHLWQSPNDLLLYIANGVTHVREMNGSLEHLQWRQEIENGRIGPKLFVASNRIGSDSVFKGLFQRWVAKITSLHSPDQAEGLLKSLEETGYDAVKVSSFLSKKDFDAVNAAADSAPISVMGHIPIAVRLDDVWSSSLEELAHIEEIVKALNREFGGFNDNTSDAFLTFVEARSDDVAQRLVDNDIAVVTTLWLMESFVPQKHDLNSVLSNVELAYVNPGITELSPLSSRVMGWLPDSNIYRIDQDHTHDGLESNKRYWNTYVKAHHILLKSMVKAGVTLMAGTDANVPAAVPGFSLHDELKSLAEAGMTASQALRSATAAPASRMKLNSGKIAAGFDADLILLDSNPLEDIRHTKTINVVIGDGRLITRQTLDDLLDVVKKANDNSRTENIDKFD